MNIGGNFAIGDGFDATEAAPDDERKRRELEQARRRIARKAADLERRRDSPALTRAEHALRPPAARRRPEAIVHAFGLEKSGEGAVQLDALLKDAFDAAPAPAGTQARPSSIDGRAATMPHNEATCGAKFADAAAVQPPMPPEPSDGMPATRDASPRLIEALGELREIGRAIEALREGSKPDSLPRSAAEVVGEHAARSTEGAGARERLDARLAFFEGFYAGMLGPAEGQLLETAVAQARAALLPPAPLQAEKGAACLDEHAAGPDPRNRLALDRLVDSACQAIAAGVPPEAVFAQLSMQFEPRPAGAASRGPLAVEAALRARPSPAVFEALQRAVGRMDPSDERKALIESLLRAQQPLAEASDHRAQEAAAAVQSDQAAQQRLIDSRHAGESLPLVVLRAL